MRAYNYNFATWMPINQCLSTLSVDNGYIIWLNYYYYLTNSTMPIYHV